MTLAFCEMKGYSWYISTRLLYGIPSLKLRIQTLRWLFKSWTILHNCTWMGFTWQLRQTYGPRLNHLHCLIWEYRACQIVILQAPNNPSIQKLLFLPHIRLDQNHINDLIPKFLANLTKLKDLHPSFCKLQVIPIIYVLDLPGNKKKARFIARFSRNWSL